MYTIDSEEVDLKNEQVITRNEQNLDEGEMEEIRQVGDNDSDSFKKESFYQPSRKRGSKKFLFIFIFLALLAVLGLFFKYQIKGIFIKASPTPTPATATPAPTPTQNPLNRSDWSLEVLNGSGVTGQAKKLADKLKEKGYVVVRSGNADKQNYDTSQIFIKKEQQDKVNLVVADLKDIVKISSVAGELKDSTASARIIIGKDLSL